MLTLPNIPGGTIDEPEEKVLRQVTIYHEDGSQEKAYILEQMQKRDNKAARRHTMITQIYMLVSIVAIVATSIIAFAQIKKNKM